MPHLVMSARAVEAGLRNNPNRVVLVATSGSEIVGYGNIYLPDAPGARVRITVLVTPEHRGAGIGSALAERITTRSAETGAASLLVVVSDDDQSRDFAVRRGFVLGRELSHASADLSAVPDAPPVPNGLRVADFDAVTPRALWDALAASAHDDPSGLSEAPPYDEFLAVDWNHPELRRDLSIVVLDGDTVLAFATTTVDPERKVIWSASTGTIPAARGRGLAKLVKAVALGRARDAGLITAVTGNDADNQPMLAVNKWLGYQRGGSAWTAEKVL
ncbi:GNAT family N-acetyltransferase [Kribbella antibiotica]|uniref:GNAT family N-acetyltransferase n=2 Tax=Kribbella antibiotica TaxID=190195 RepID=A0A4R4YKE1_9ACTN|nr:GNAT family N-acetyltransferase [Kribbella antibiotica]